MPRSTAAVLLLLPTLCSANSAQHVVYGSIATQDELPPCTATIRCNGHFCADVCMEGSVQIDPWFTSTLAFQRRLQSDRALHSVQLVGTHNAFISRSNGMGLTEDLASYLFARSGSAPSNASTVRVSNQRYAATDLLNMGVRHLEVDIWLTDVLLGVPVICHSPVIDPLYALELQAAADALGMGALQYDAFHELCSNITLVNASERVRSWLESNPGEVVGLFLDNRVPSADIDTVSTALLSVFGDSMMTPTDLRTLFGGVWPSPNAMLAAGKRLFVESNCYSPNNYTGSNFTDYVFNPTTWDAYQDGPTSMAPFPNCSIKGDASWYGKSFVRMLEGSVTWYPDYDERQDGVAFKPNGYADLIACGASNVAIADFGPHVLPGLVWTWLAGEPKAAPGNCSAGAMTTVRGRWTAQPCTRAMPAICRNGTAVNPAGASPSAWRLTVPVDFAGAAPACAALGNGWAFDLPRDGRENALVAALAMNGSLWLPGAAAGVWLNVTL